MTMVWLASEYASGNKVKINIEDDFAIYLKWFYKILVIKKFLKIYLYAKKKPRSNSQNKLE